MAMYTVEDHWEGWIRPVLFILLAVVLGGAWWLGRLPDRWLGGALLAAVGLAPAGMVIARGWSRRLPIWKRALTAAVAVAAVGVAAVSPASILRPDARIGAGEATRRAPRVELPPTGDRPADWLIYAHGDPGFERSSAELILALAPEVGPARTHTGRLVEKRGRRGRGGKEKHDVVWRVRADLSAGAEIRVETPPRELGWPIRLQVRRAPPSHRVLLYASLPLLLLGAALDGLARVRVRTYLGPLTAGAGAFAILFATWYTPGALVKTVFGAALGAAVAGAVIGVPLAAVAGRLAPREAGREL
ncbi:MAG: hypothetical protein ACQEXJ_17465 [Myxococcota bacterium]